jgi:guanylate kinase
LIIHIHHRRLSFEQYHPKPHPTSHSSLSLFIQLQNGVHYHFTDKETFEKEIAEGKFLEYAYVHDNIYGTSIKAVQDVAEAGKCCILDIDVQGARQVRESGLPAIFVFIAPPSLDELERRLRGRGTESEEQITTRLRNAHNEMASLEENGLYDHVLINSDVDACLVDLQTVAARALAGQTGLPSRIPADDSSLLNTGGSHASLKEPPSATASLRGWLGDTGSPVALESPGVGAILNIGLARWRGRVALVTGASGAVGGGIALALASSGVKVVAISRRKAQLEELQEAASAAGISLSDFLPVVCDLTKEAEVSALPRIVARRWPGSGIDVLVNAVGAGRKAGDALSGGGGGSNGKKSIENDFSLLTGSSSAWVEAISAGVLGTALVSREVIAEMKKRGETGHIVNVTCCLPSSSFSSSFNGGGGGGDPSSTSSNSTTNSSSKGMQVVAAAAAKAMAEELRAEVAAAGVSVRVSCVAAGAIAGVAGTPSAANGGSGGTLAVDDVVAAVAFCLSAPPHADVSEIVVKPVSKF